MSKQPTATATKTCEATTRSGARCRRRALAASAFCAQHAGKATEAPGVPPDIDESAFAEVKSDLGNGQRYDSGATEQSQGVLEDLASVAEFFVENAGRVKEAAVNNGIVDASLVERFVGDLVNALTSSVTAFAERMSGEYEEDDFGFDETFTNNFLVPIMGLFYDYYWRVDVDGVEHVPAEGRAMLVSNHAGGGLPFDGAMIKLAILREHSRPRHARMMVLDWAMGLPWLADMMRKTGQVLACTPNALELLEREELVGVFPEGVKGMSKPFSQRYNLQRFGRGGFVRIALRTRSPIVPVAVVGSEEIYPKIGQLPLVNKLIGAPFVPVTPLFPLFGLMGLVPLPSKWHIEFCDPIDVSEYPPEAADDRTLVLELSERIRATIQKRLRANLLKRHTPFW